MKTWSQGDAQYKIVGQKCSLGYLLVLLELMPDHALVCIRHQHGGFLGFVTIAVYGRSQYFLIYFITKCETRQFLSIIVYVLYHLITL